MNTHNMVAPAVTVVILLFIWITVRHIQYSNIVRKDDEKWMRRVVEDILESACRAQADIRDDATEFPHIIIAASCPNRQNMLWARVRVTNETIRVTLEWKYELSASTRKIAYLVLKGLLEENIDAKLSSNPSEGMTWSNAVTANGGSSTR